MTWEVLDRDRREMDTYLNDFVEGCYLSAKVRLQSSDK